MPTAKIGRYEIRRELGRGMMGVVYEAHDPALGRTIALKTIQLTFAVSEQERKSFEARFLTEARVAARLSHPGIVVVHDVGQDAESGALYIALEYLRGRTLAEVAAEGKLFDWREALHVVKRLAEALHHAHSEGVIHRDIKPANIMMLASGEPKIMDFGIAKIEAGQLTATGQFFGTPLYMSPEQALGRKLDPRSDLFSLGALAYGLLTGQQAFGGAGLPRIITRVVSEDPDPPSHVRSVPPEVDYLIARALAKEPDNRYPNGKVLAEDIEDILAGRPARHQRTWAAPRRADGTLVSLPTTRQRAPEPREQRRPPPRRRLPWIAIASIAALAVAATTAAIVMGRSRREPAAGAPMTPVVRPMATPSAVAPPETLPGPPPTLAAATPEPAPSPQPRPVAEQPVASPLAAKPEVSDAARALLAIDFEHSLKYGRLRIWVDDALVVEQELDSRVTRKIASLRLRKGGVQQTLELPAGRHEVKVQVAWDDKVKTGRIWANFDAGSTRRLSAKLGGGIGGLVKKDLDLEWE